MANLLDRLDRALVGIWDRRVRPLSSKQKLIAMLVVGLIVYGGLIALDNLVIRQWITGVSGDPIDLEYYRNRTTNILDGLIPYKDFHSESPPLIMYLMLPPQYFGGELWMYQVYFSAYTVLMGAVFYLGLRRFDDEKAFAVGLAYILMPYAVIESTFGVQDDMISSFFFFLPLILIVSSRMMMSGLTASLGLWTKLFNAIVFPWVLLSDIGKKEKLRFLLAMAIVAIIVALPFLILYPEEFISFPSYYFLRNPDAPTGGSGQSPWHFLDLGGYTIPGTVGVIMAVGAVAVATLLAYKWKLRFWQGCVFIMVAFFLFYPKIAFVYFLLPVGLMLPYAIQDRRVMWRLVLMAIPLFMAVPFSENGETPVLDYSWGWIVGLVLSLIGWFIFVLAFRLTWKKGNFFEKADRLE